jgi:[ribosomal protein S5]-alanine N-acetyltransferase
MRKEKIFESLPVLETERLLLRAIEENDSAAIFDYACDPEVARYTTWDAHKSMEDAKNLVRFIRKRYSENKPSNWAVILKNQSRLLGTCGFVSGFPVNKRAELGFSIRKDCWNKGYMTEAVRKVIDFGFKVIGLNRIEACCDAENKASARVLEKCGLKFEGVLRQYVFNKGKFRDIRSYSILAEEYGK